MSQMLMIADGVKEGGWHLAPEAAVLSRVGRALASCDGGIDCAGCAGFCGRGGDEMVLPLLGLFAGLIGGSPAKNQAHRGSCEVVLSSV